MTEKIVGMITSYPGVNQSDWLCQQTPYHFGKWGNIRIQANHPQPDFLLLYQFDFFKPPKKLSWKERLKQTLKPHARTPLSRNCRN
jgi:hypothetical protein